jgi:signal transduction histidine kinase
VDGGVRVIATSRVDPALLARQGTLDRDLYYRLGVLAIHLPPLRERIEDIPSLVSAVAESLCARLGLTPVSFSEAAFRRLSRYLWFGNLAELEAVTARSIVFASSSHLDTADLRFGYGAATASPRAGAPATAAAAPRKEANGLGMDLVIQELAHEFKNPMVTIKTFAHQIDHLLDRDGGHEEFARLTGEAVERMDAALENLVQYTRFETPARQASSLGALLSAALADVRDCVDEKHLSLEVEPTSASVFVDPEQCGYALKNLLRTVARDLSTGDALAVRSVAPSSLSIEYPARARIAATALSKLVLGESNGREILPLGFTFARTLIERNGGRLTLAREGDVAKVLVELPLGGDEKGENGQAESLGSR